MAAQSSPVRPSARASVRSRWLTTAGILVMALVVIAGFVALYWLNALPQHVDEQQTIVLGPTRFAPDSDASLRVVVQDLAGGQPVAGAQVQVSLKPASGPVRPLFTGQTDATGSLPVRFHVPADMPQEAHLIVETSSSAGRDRLEQAVTIQRDYRLLLTTDKPLYQPGQTIHMRALALSSLDLTPARGTAVDFLVEDPKGNKVFRQSVSTSDFGIAAADFTLADMVNQGNYRLSVSLGNTQSEKTVEVRPYVLPKFSVQISTDRSYYLPGQRVEGKVQVDYFFGKPVAGGEVQLVGSVWDVQRTVVVDLRGQTDENGSYAFSFDLPSYFAGSGLESGQAQFALEVTVVDQAKHAEQNSQVLPIAAEPLVIEAVAESGVLKPGVENIIYILTSYPDGRPAPANLLVTVASGPVALSSGEFGLAEFSFTPTAEQAQPLYIQAQDEAGLSAGRQFLFEAEPGGDTVLLRADRAAYVVGETMHLVVLTPVQAGSIYLDIVKAGQTLSTRSTAVQNGRAEFAIDVTPDLYSTLELHAYKVLLDGGIVRDTRLVVVDAPNDIAIAISADRDTYRPGDPATLTFRTSAGDQGVQTALGVAVVDESVFALQQQDPGFAKLYFLLRQELLEPLYQVKGFELPAAIPPEQEPVRQAQDVAAKASWASFQVALGQPVNSRLEKVQAVYEAQVTGLARLGQASAVVLALIPLALWVVVVLALRQTGIAGRALGRFAVAVGILLGAVPLACGLAVVLLRLPGEEVLAIWLAIVGLGALALGIYAWTRGDRAARWLALLTLLWVAFVILLVGSAGRWEVFSLAGQGVPTWLLLVAALAYLLMPAAYLLFGQGRWMQQRRLGGAVATGLGALSALPAMAIPLLLVLALSGPRIGGIFGLVSNMQEERPIGILGLVAGDRAQLAQPTPAALAPASTAQARGEPPRLRQYFPETLYWAPEVVTDQGGSVTLQIPMADSITTWRLTALASTQDGRLGFTTRGVRVFQDFFVDIDLPVALTVGDEIGIPVAVYNYLPSAQQVSLVVQEEPWFTLQGPATQTLTIASNEVTVVYFPIRVVEFGRQGFQVTAWGEKMSDAIRREVLVVPNGKEIRLTESNWLRESREVPIQIPAETIAGTAYAEVKIYPGVLSQVVEGLEKILRLPFG